MAKQNRWQEAAAVYRKWTATGIDHAKALENLAIAYEQAGEFGKAASVLEQKRALWPEDQVDRVQHLATLYLRAGNPHSALSVLEKYEARHCAARENIPAEFDNVIGAVLLTLADRAAAEQYFRSALQKNPHLTSAQRNLDQLETSGTQGPSATNVSQ